MGNTTANEVIQSFESSFADKTVLPVSLEMEWFKKAVGRYSAELSDLNFDPELNQFDTRLDRYTIDTLAEFMKQSYQERQYSKVNKRISITGKDLGIDGSNGSKTATKAELDYITEKANTMVGNQKVTAFL